MTTAAHAQELFRRAQAVCFDVDSTVIREEGIDELAKFCGVGDAVTEMSAHTHTHTHALALSKIRTLAVFALVCLHDVFPL